MLAQHYIIALLDLKGTVSWVSDFPLRLCEIHQQSLTPTGLNWNIDIIENSLNCTNSVRTKLGSPSLLFTTESVERFIEGPAPHPYPPLSKLDRRHKERMRKTLADGRWGGGAESYDRKKAWAPINHSILSILCEFQETINPTISVREGGRRTNSYQPSLLEYEQHWPLVYLRFSNLSLFPSCK